MPIDRMSSVKDGGKLKTYVDRLTRLWGFDAQSARTYTVPFTGKDPIRWSESKARKIRNTVRSNVEARMRQIKAEYRRKHIRYYREEAYRIAVEHEWKDFRRRGFRRDSYSDFITRYYFGESRKPSEEMEQEFKRMLREEVLI